MVKDQSSFYKKKFRWISCCSSAILLKRLPFTPLSYPDALLLLLLLLRWNLCNIKLTILKCRIQWHLEHSWCCATNTSIKFQNIFITSKETRTLSAITPYPWYFSLILFLEISQSVNWCIWSGLDSVLVNYLTICMPMPHLKKIL